MTKFLILSGVHGNEQNAVLSVITAMKSMVSKYGDCKISDRIVNLPGLEACTREIPEQKPETRDMNRMYGTPADFNLKDTLYMIKHSVYDSDIVIDVHNSPCCPNMILISNNEYAKNYVCFASEHRICYAVRESATDTVKKYAIEAEKVGITVELGGMGFGPKHGEVIKSQVEFIDNLVFHLRGLATATPDYFRKKHLPLPPEDMMYPVYAHCKGILNWKVELGTRVPPRTAVAEVIDHVGNVAEQICTGSTYGGVVDAEERLCVKPGSCVCYIQPDAGNR